MSPYNLYKSAERGNGTELLRWMMEAIFKIEQFLCDADRQTVRLSRELYRENPELAEVLARLRLEIQKAKSEVVRSVRFQTAA